MLSALETLARETTAIYIVKQVTVIFKWANTRGDRRSLLTFRDVTSELCEFLRVTPHLRPLPPPGNKPSRLIQALVVS